MNFSKAERESYEDRLKSLRNEASAVDLAEPRGIEKAALNMLKQGLEAQVVCQVTSLSLDKIKGLFNSKISAELTTERGLA